MRLKNEEKEIELCQFFFFLLVEIEVHIWGK